MVPMAFNMISIIRLNQKMIFKNDEEEIRKSEIKRKAKRVILLFAALIVSMFLISFIGYLSTRIIPSEKQLASIDFDIVKVSKTKAADNFHATHVDTINLDKKHYYFILFTDFASTLKRGRSLLPVAADLKSDSLLAINLRIKGVNGGAYDITKSIIGADSLSLEYRDYKGTDYFNIVNSYRSIDELIKEYNYAFSGEIDFMPKEYGEGGIVFEISSNPLRANEDGKYQMALNFKFKSGKIVNKEKTFFIRTDGKNNKESNVALDSPILKPVNFVDSILAKQELSISEIKRYTSLDSIYYTGIYSNSMFQGDTVIDVRGKYKALIIDYSSGRSSAYKFLFIYDPDKLHTGEEKVVYTDTDREEGDSYLFTRYKFLNDSTFQTIDTLLDTHDEPHVRGREVWRIDKSGIMRSIQH
jgi:hypothetical protein